MEPSPSSGDLVFSNEYLVTEILLRVPARSALRFKLVSKKWLSLISQPDFAIRNTHLSRSTVCGLLLKISPSYMYLPFDGRSTENLSFGCLSSFDPDRRESTFVTQSCNGLLLCSANGFWPGVSYPKSTYYVFNPTTRQVTKLPPLPSSEKGFGRVQLAFDPSKSPNYQAVCVYSSRSTRVIYVYSSETKVWRLITVNPSLLSARMDFDRGVFWNDCIHWMNHRGDGLRFMFGEETLQRIPRPPLPDDWETSKFKYFGGSGNYLHFIVLDGDQNLDASSSSSSPGQMENNNAYIVYAIGRGYSKWFAKYRLELDMNTMVTPEDIMCGTGRHCLSHPLESYILMLALFENGDVSDQEEPFLVLSILGRTVSYNLKNRTFKKLGRFYHGNYPSISYAYKYMETLSPV